MAENIADIKEKTIEQSKKIINERVKVDFQELKKGANEFLTQVSAVYNTATAEGNLKERTHSKGKTQIMRIWSLYTSAQVSQTLALLQNKFAIILDEFLGRQIILTYVTEEGQLILYTRQSQIDILAHTSKNAGRANFKDRILKQSKISNKKNDSELSKYKQFFYQDSDIIQMINDSTKDKQEVYQTAIQRYKGVNKGNYKTEVSIKDTYYATFTKPYKVFYSPGFSRGELAQGYADAVISDPQSSIINKNDIQWSLGVLYYRYIKGHKDSVGAIKTGDVVVSEDGKISLAVKGQSASTAKIGQYIVAASLIMQMNESTPQDIENMLSKLPSIDKYAKKVEEYARQKFNFDSENKLPIFQKLLLEKYKIDIPIGEIIGNVL